MPEKEAGLDPTVRRFVEMLDEASALLRAEARSEGREYLTKWADWLEKGARIARKRDLRGVLHVLSAYGGMGSFNDIFFTNKRLERLRSEIWRLGDELVKAERRAEMQEERH